MAQCDTIENQLDSMPGKQKRSGRERVERTEVMQFEAQIPGSVGSGKAAQSVATVAMSSPRGHAATVNLLRRPRVLIDRTSMMGEKDGAQIGGGIATGCRYRCRRGQTAGRRSGSRR